MSMPIAPPDQVVKLVLEVASRSPCRSKRGVVLYDPRGAPSGAGHNGPPNDTCPGRAICTGTCSQRAVHAEVRALRAAQIGRTATAALGGRLEPLDLVHVERAADGGVVVCDGPSCRGCAAQILDSSFVGWVWLYEGS
jgi:deoxycytidylate deaminase